MEVKAVYNFWREFLIGLIALNSLKLKFLRSQVVMVFANVVSSKKEKNMPAVLKTDLNVQKNRLERPLFTSY